MTRAYDEGVTDDPPPSLMDDQELELIDLTELRAPADDVADEVTSTRAVPLPPPLRAPRQAELVDQIDGAPAEMPRPAAIGDSPGRSTVLLVVLVGLAIGASGAALVFRTRVVELFTR
jgi:hypothetical protein